MSFLHPAQQAGECFCNAVPTEIGGWRLMARVLPLYLRNREERFPRDPLRFVTDPEAFRSAPGSGLRITWFGHSSALIEVDGLRVLLDPVWDGRASPVTWAGPKRFFSPTIELTKLPDLDVILISHDHYDHLGEATIRRLSLLPCAARAQWITSLKVGPILRSFGVPGDRITEMNWMDAVPLLSAATGETLATLSAYPARHFSGRSVRSRFHTLWSAFVLAGTKHTLYLGADTGWWPGFAEIAARHPSFDLVLLEIGAFNELWADIHLGPDGAVRAYKDLGTPGMLMPIHWGLFDLALHAWRQPIERLTALADEQRLKLWSPTPGVPTEVCRDVEVRSGWWRPAQPAV